MLGNVVRGKPEKGKTEGRRKTITRKTKKSGRPVSVSLSFCVTLSLRLIYSVCTNVSGGQMESEACTLTWLDI